MKVMKCWTVKCYTHFSANVHSLSTFYKCVRRSPLLKLTSFPEQWFYKQVCFDRYLWNLSELRWTFSDALSTKNTTNCWRLIKNYIFKTVKCNGSWIKFMFLAHVAKMNSTSSLLIKHDIFLMNMQNSWRWTNLDKKMTNAWQSKWIIFGN